MKVLQDLGDVEKTHKRLKRQAGVACLVNSKA